MGSTLLRWLLGVAALLLACELVFRALPVSTSTETGYHFDPLILTYPPHHAWTSSTGVVVLIITHPFVLVVISPAYLNPASTMASSATGYSN